MKTRLAKWLRGMALYLFQLAISVGVIWLFLVSIPMMVKGA